MIKIGIAMVIVGLMITFGAEEVYWSIPSELRELPRDFIVFIIPATLLGVGATIALMPVIDYIADKRSKPANEDKQ